MVPEVCLLFHIRQLSRKGTLFNQGIISRYIDLVKTQKGGVDQLFCVNGANNRCTEGGGACKQACGGHTNH